MALDFLRISAYIILFGFFWNYIKGILSASGDRPGRLAQGMAFVH
jgi:hypothetical protein